MKKLCFFIFPKLGKAFGFAQLLFHVKHCSLCLLQECFPCCPVLQYPIFYHIFSYAAINGFLPKGLRLRYSGPVFDFPTARKYNNSGIPYPQNTTCQQRGHPASIPGFSYFSPKAPSAEKPAPQELTTVTTHCNKNHKYPPECPHTTFTRPANSWKGKSGQHLDMYA